MFRRAFLLILLTSILVTGCRKEKPSAPGLVIGLASSGVTFDPHLHDEESSYSTLAHFYNTLVGFSSEMELLPELAHSWQNPSDTLWRFQLRRDVSFQDGRPFEAEDAAASIRRAMHLPGSKVAYYLQAVESVKAVDPYTIEVKTRFPNPVLLNKLVFIGMLPRDAEFKPVTKPLGTGPYIYVSGQPGKEVEARRYPKYWGGAPAFSTVKIVPFPDDKERVSAVSRGLADVSGRLSEEYWEWGETLPESRLVTREGLGVSMLGFSFRPGSQVADIRVRRAVAAALDRQALVPSGRRDLIVPMPAIVPPSVFGHIGPPADPPPDHAMARELLAAAGFKKGLKLRVLLPTSSRELAASLASQLAPAGITLELEAYPWSDFYKRLNAGSFTTVLFNFTASTGDISDVLDALFHTPGSGYGAFDINGSFNPALDTLIEASNRTMDPYARLKHIREAVNLISAELRVLPLCVRSSRYAIRPGLDWTPRRDRRIRAFDMRPGGGV
jgi:peptide/nickel transport system substrate-binding protein